MISERYPTFPAANRLDEDNLLPLAAPLTPPQSVDYTYHKKGMKAYFLGYKIHRSTNSMILLIILLGSIRIWYTEVGIRRDEGVYRPPMLEFMISDMLPSGPHLSDRDIGASISNNYDLSVRTLCSYSVMLFVLLTLLRSSPPVGRGSSQLATANAISI